MEIKETSIRRYLKQKYKAPVSNLKITKLGSGILGTGYSLEFKIKKQNKKIILKSLFTENLGKDHFSDRAQSLLLAHDSYNFMEKHVKSHDVLALKEKGELLSLDKSKEFFILMEEAKGQDLFTDLQQIKQTKEISKETKQKIIQLSNYLVKLHAQKAPSKILYRRKIRDTIGCGESLIGVLDMYPDSEFENSKQQWEQIVKTSIGFWIKSRNLEHRTCEVHGDFHPGNLWFENQKLTILDRARGRFGEPADDIAAFTINFLFFAILTEGSFQGPYKELFDLFWNNYFKQTKDREMRKILAPYFAFRVAVVCNPIFYNDEFFSSEEKAKAVRARMRKFAINILQDFEFNPAKINDYFN